ncbi:MAG TPA: hypothetical protein VM240_05330 [Verrucomicrobiae bacterium]|nr:hypothetical protein [Verrucomicrobiae bacterium]
MALWATLALSACAGVRAINYVPSPEFPMEPVSEFTTTRAVTIVNAGDDVTLDLPARWWATRRQWTEVCATIARRELGKRGMAVDGPQARILKLAFQSVETRVGAVDVSSNAVLRVETGDGYVATYTADNRAIGVGSDYGRQMDGLMMRAVKQMLLDPKIVAYLSR